MLLWAFELGELHELFLRSSQLFDIQLGLQGLLLLLSEPILFHLMFELLPILLGLRVGMLAFDYGLFRQCFESFTF